MKATIFLTIAALCVAHAHAADVTPTLGIKGKVLLEEKFESGAVPAGWNKNTGVIRAADGVLHLSELASEKHAGAFRKPLPLRDCAIQMDFRFEGATALHLGFDPAPGELKKKGHLFSVIINPASWNVTEHNDKANPQSKNVQLAKADAKFVKGQWYTLLLEVKGDNVAAQVGGQSSLKATSQDFHVKKPGLVFRVAGKDGQEVLLDNVSVWELN